MGTDIQFIHGDCLDALSKMDAESVDLVVTSPPYNLGIKYSSYKDTKTDAEYLQWCCDWATELKRLLHPDGSFFLNIGASPQKPLLPHAIALRFSEIFELQNTFHWIKSVTIKAPAGDAISAGHFKPINSKRYVTDCHEYVFHFTKSGNVPLDRLAIGVPYVHKSNINRWGHTKGEDLRCRGNTWFIPYKTINKRDKDRPHPATFPCELASYCINIHGNAAKLHMLDPFVGIGHAAIAAAQNKVKKFTGIDIDASYLKAGEEALEAALKADPTQEELPL